MAGGATTLVVHPSVTVTHAALELLRKAGVRVIPYVEPSSGAARAGRRAARRRGPSAGSRSAVQARLGGRWTRRCWTRWLRRVLAAL